MYRIKILITVVLCLFTVSCSQKEKHTVVGDELTEDTSVTSVVDSREPDISAGNEAFLQGNFEDAISYYETGLRQNRSVAYYNMGVSYYLLHNIVEAEKAFKLALDEDPTFDEAIMNLVAVLAEQEKTEEAERYVSRLVNKQKTARVYVDMANLSIKNGSSAKARFYYEKALAINKEEPFVLSNYANYLISIGELDEGERILNALEYKDFAVYYNLAYIAWLRGDKQRALDMAIDASKVLDDSEEGNNKLAALFSLMKEYQYESDTLRKLIIWNPKKEYRLRLVQCYLHSLDLARAEDEATQLLSDYPHDGEVIVQYYDVTIAKGLIAEAGRFISRESERQPDNDRLFYHNIRHISLYDYNPNEAMRLINNNRKDTPFINLARAAYNIRVNNYINARNALVRVPETTYNDYYIYRSFVSFKEGNLDEAQEIAFKINDTKPEYFWYHFVLAWNLRDADRITELLGNYREDYIINSRVPIFSFNLSPVKEDMYFTFTYDNKGSDMAAMLLYPFFIEPDEMYPFLALGYRLLKEQDGQAALSELSKSIDYSNAVIQNNEGVKHMLNFDYLTAMRYFAAADNELELDPFLHYNIGLAEYHQGNYDAAEERFDRAIRLNRYIVPAYVGKGLIIERKGDKRAADRFYEAAIINAEEYQALENLIIVMPMLIQTKYLALLAQERPDRLLELVKKENSPNNFVKSMTSLANYLITKDENYIETFRNNNIYHSAELNYLMDLYLHPYEAIEKPARDPGTIMMAKYVTAMQNGTLNETFLEPYLNDQKVLIDMVNHATLLGARADALKYLQTLSRIDIRYIPQYRSALYYFMSIQDFVNAEASYTTLERLNAGGQDLRYYMMLNFLLDYNQRRLAPQVENYLKDFPGDYKGLLIAAMKELQENNYRQFLSQLTDLMEFEPELFNKMPLEIDIVRF